MQEKVIFVQTDLIIMKHFYKRFLFAFALLIIVIIGGAMGFHFLVDENSPFIDCIYMTFITITTIGYGEVIDVTLHPLGRVFTMLIAISGIGIFTYILTNITALIVEGEILQSYKRSRVIKMISKLKNHYIICGATGVSLQIVNELMSTHRDFVFIDKEEHNFNTSSKKEFLFLKGDPTDEHILETAGIKKATGVFATTNDDNINLVITFTSRQLNKGLRIVSKCNHSKNVHKIKIAGANSVVSPNHIGGLRIVSEMVRPKVVTFLDTMLRDKEKNLRVEEIHISDRYSGKTVLELDLQNNSNALLMAIREDDKWLFNPPVTHKIKAGDVLILMITPEERELLHQKFSM